MRAQEHPKSINWSVQRIGIISVISACISLALLYLFKLTSSAPLRESNNWLSDFANLLSVLTLLVGLSLPWLVLLCWHALLWLLPRPGSRVYGPTHCQMLQKAFDIERGDIGAAMVPDHEAMAKPARSTRNIDLGDADLILTRAVRRRLRSFLTKPRVRTANRSSERKNLEQEILLVTGEPGAGKSVLLQEIHASLSLGVERGAHSFVPLFVFARDLSLSSLREAEKDSESPMRAFLKNYYESRYKSNVANEDLAALYRLVSNDWEVTDCLIIIDGLDEISQRSAYEEIQQSLAIAILADLRSDRRAVHRFILSCRVDENLDLFPDGKSLFIRGLARAERERYCRALVKSGNFDKATRRSLERALGSRRLIPAHVFRRNPYFMALLTRHIREDQDSVQGQEIINFDYLMRKYLEREATRLSGRLAQKKGDNVDDRKRSFSELERIAQISLQYLAFRSASSATIGALYNDTTITSKLLLGFLRSIKEAEPIVETKSLWTTLNTLLDHAVDPQRTTNIPAGLLDKLDTTRYLRENDILLLDSAGLKLNRGAQIDETTMRAILGMIPHTDLSEPETWYADLLQCFSGALHKKKLSAKHSLALLIFLRSMVAAHALRILIISINGESISVRFRHRRLAEYYAACYVRDKWPSLRYTLEPSPWLGSILNLTAALEGPRCSTLHWLLDRLEKLPQPPYYKWRFSMGTILEASFFAHPGTEYDRAIARLCDAILFALANSRGNSFANNTHEQTIEARATDSNRQRSSYHAIDAVSEIALLRGLEQLASLSTVLGPTFSLNESDVNSFHKYQVNAPAEWVGQILPANFAIQDLTKKRPPRRISLINVLKVFQCPETIFTTSFRRRWFYLTTLRSAALLSLLLREAILLLFVLSFPWILVGIVSRLLKVGWQVESGALTMLLLLLAISWALFRVEDWWYAPTKAVSRTEIIGELIGFITARLKSIALIPARLIRAVRRSLRVFSLLLTNPILFFTKLRTLISRFVEIVGKGIRHLISDRWWRNCLEISGLFALSILMGLIFVYPWTSRRTSVVTVPHQAAIANDTSPDPCADIADKAEEVFTSLKDDSIRIGDSELEPFQQRIRQEIESLRLSNVSQQCGSKNGETLVLSEEVLADRLVTFDPFLIPTPSSNQSFKLNAAELKNLFELLTKPELALPDGDSPGYMVAITQYFAAKRIVNDVELLSLRIVKARREGIGIPSDNEYFSQISAVTDDQLKQGYQFKKYGWLNVGDWGGIVEYTPGDSHVIFPDLLTKPPKRNETQGVREIKLANKVVDSLSGISIHHQLVLWRLTDRLKTGMIHAMVFTLTIGLLLILSRFFLLPLTDRKHIATIRSERDVWSLCQFIYDWDYSDRVRAEALRRLSIIGIRDERELGIIENIVRELLQSSFASERSIGIRTAQLTRTLANRLRHRVTVDAPVRVRY